MLSNEYTESMDRSVVMNAKDRISSINNLLIDLKKNKGNINMNLEREISDLKRKKLENYRNRYVNNIIDECIRIKSIMNADYNNVVNRTMAELWKSLLIFKQFLSIVGDDQIDEEKLVNVHNNIIGVIDKPADEIDVNPIINNYNNYEVAVNYYFNKIRPVLFSSLFERLQMFSPNAQQVIPNIKLMIRPLELGGKKFFYITSHKEIRFAFHIDKLRTSKDYIEVEYNTNPRLSLWRTVDRSFCVEGIMPLAECSFKRANDDTLIVERLEADLQFTLKKRFNWYVNFNNLVGAKEIQLVDTYTKPNYPDDYKVNANLLP